MGQEFEHIAREAGVTFVPRVGPKYRELSEFPTVLLESGWAEASTELRDSEDARVWQLGSRKAVRVVLLAKFYPADRHNEVRFVLSISCVEPNGPFLHDHYVSEYASCLLLIT